MSRREELRDELIGLSRWVGAPERRLAVLGEGNLSVACEDGTFWVKASGASLAELGADGVSLVRLEPILSLARGGRPEEKAIEEALVEALADPAHRKPSVETFLHAACLDAGADWVGHAHPESANAILCSRRGAEPFERHVFPDAVVVCGPSPAVVPYVDPGWRLAEAAGLELERYVATHGVLPKVLLLENHGVVALGASAREVRNVLVMLDKWARILHATFALGGPAYLPPEEVARIDGRLDEHYRRRRLAEGEDA